MRRGGVWIALGAVLALTAGCTDWPTWGGGLERQGNNTDESVVGTANVGQLHPIWDVNLGAYINASPILARSIPIDGNRTDLVYVGTEHGVMFAITTDGRPVWFRSLGSEVADCLDTPDKTYGISASAVFDRAGNRLFVVGGDGKVYALDPATGATLPGWPVTITTIPGSEFVYSAPTLAHGQLYVAVASRCDNPPYHGRLVSIDTSTQATNAFYVTGGPSGPSGGGIWGWGGASVDPATGDVYVATGNSLESPENGSYAEHVVRLSSTLQVKAAHSPGVGVPDDDFGSSPLLFQKPGCPPQLVVQKKNGNLYLYDRDTIANGFRQVVTVTTQEWIGEASYSPSTQLVYVVNGGGNDVPGSIYHHGLLAFRLDASCNLQLAWQAAAPVFVGSTATIANGVVYYSGGGGYANGAFPGLIHAIDAQTGTELWSSGASVTGSVFAAPVLVNGLLYVGSYDGHLHAWGI
jgi:outer membrane protein assembly factor BamB